MRVARQVACTFARVVQISLSGSCQLVMSCVSIHSQLSCRGASSRLFRLKNHLVHSCSVSCPSCAVVSSSASELEFESEPESEPEVELESALWVGALLEPGLAVGLALLVGRLWLRCSIQIGAEPGLPKT